MAVKIIFDPYEIRCSKLQGETEMQKTHLPFPGATIQVQGKIPKCSLLQ